MNFWKLTHLKYSLLLGSILMVFSSCEPDSTLPEPELDTQPSYEVGEAETESSHKATTMGRFVTSGSGGHFTDGSGTITTQVFWSLYESSGGKINGVTASVPADYVVVGGGASINYGTGGGAMITESRPDVNNRSIWVASSSDFHYPNEHQMWVYAVGMKISGVSAATLRQYTTVQLMGSQRSLNPDLTFGAPSGYQLLGGGVKLLSNCHNCLNIPHFVQANYPVNANQWNVESGHVDNYVWNQIEGYAIGIKSIPGYGSVEIGFFQQGASYNSGPTTHDYSDLPNGWVLAGAGGYTASEDRFIYRMQPWNGGVSVESKDHMDVYRSGYTHAYAIGVRKPVANACSGVSCPPGYFCNSNTGQCEYLDIGGGCIGCTPGQICTPSGECIDAF
ncbi:MAG: hypothetical protein AAFQ98_10975 [Bacteroidota bacterium]